MQARFTQSFKIQAVEKALSRTDDTSIREVAKMLGVGYSTLTRWIVKSRNNEFDEATNQLIRMDMAKDKRPQDWSLEDRFAMVLECNSLDEEAVSHLCRERGIYPHHLKQWKLDFIAGSTADSNAQNTSQMKALKNDVKNLKKELNRKDKALAETAALLVLQKKVNDIWGTDEDN
jgi:transposase